MPVVVSNYVAGTLFTITVQWTWNGNPNPDYTLKVYSKLSGVNILNSSLGTVILNYNGSSPSGFTNSNYTGMTSSCSSFISNTSTSKHLIQHPIQLQIQIKLLNNKQLRKKYFLQRFRD